MNLPISDPGQAALSGSNGGQADGGLDDGAGPDLPPRQPAKFLYPSGSKPLDGYTIKRGVGRGGFGEVYFATSDAGKEVALKLIRRNLDVELRGVRHCLNLKHQNLIDLYDIRVDDLDDQWVVMEYVSGQSLEEAIEAHPNGMPLELVEWWIRGIAGGVGYLHDHGIVHRDLKPGNIFLDAGGAALGDPGTIKIGDYGLSKFISCSRRSGQTESVGTVHYMAPEIANGRYGREIDTYALGVILYEMLTGHVPFEGESVGEVLMKHLTAEPDLVRIGEPYRTIVSRALTKDPELRLSSVEEMVAMLPSAADQPSAPVAPANVPPAMVAPWAPVSRPPHTDFPTPQREPLWQGLVDICEGARARWRAWHAPPLGKGLVLFGIVTAAIITSPGWLTIVGALAGFYLIYYVVWAAFLQEPIPSAPPTPTATVAYERPAKPSVSKRVRYNWRLAALKQRSERSLREKAVSLTGSMLGSAAIAITASVIAAPLLAKGTSVDPTVLGVWLASVTTLGSWGALSSSAAASTYLEDHLPRRGMGLLAGMILGAVSFGVMTLLGLQLPFSHQWEPGPHEVAMRAFGLDLYQGASNEDGMVAVPIAASLAYFGLLFTFIRWWRSSDYLRRTRVGLWSIAVTALAAWLVTLITWFPQPLGLVVAGLIALATQAASPWCPPSRRIALARGKTGEGIYDV